MAPARHAARATHCTSHALTLGPGANRSVERACRCQLGPEEGSRAKKEVMPLWTSRATLLSVEVYGLSFEPHCPMDFLHLSSLTPMIWLPPTIIVQGGAAASEAQMLAAAPPSVSFDTSEARSRASDLGRSLNCPNIGYAPSPLPPMCTFTYSLPPHILVTGLSGAIDAGPPPPWTAVSVRHYTRVLNSNFQPANFRG